MKKQYKIDIEEEALKEKRKKEKSLAPPGSELHNIIMKLLCTEFSGESYKKFNTKTKMINKIKEEIKNLPFEELENKSKFLNILNNKYKSINEILLYLGEVFFEGE